MIRGEAFLLDAEEGTLKTYLTNMLTLSRNVLEN